MQWGLSATSVSCHSFYKNKKPTEEAGKTAVSISEEEMRQGDWLEAYGPYGLT